MTREEAKTVFLNRGYVEVEGGTIYDADKWRESCRVISEWLEQEPCEDAISRADALKALDYDIKSFEFKSGVGRHMNEIANLLNTIYEIQSDNIKALPPVQPKPKTGHWIKGKCDQCGGHAPFWSMATTYYESEYCPHCGAKMEVEQNG